jgi:hypothetical protein
MVIIIMLSGMKKVRQGVVKLAMDQMKSIDNELDRLYEKYR